MGFKVAIRILKADAAKYHIDSKRIIVSGSFACSYLAVMVDVTGNSTIFLFIAYTLTIVLQFVRWLCNRLR